MNAVTKIPPSGVLATPLADHFGRELYPHLNDWGRGIDEMSELIPEDQLPALIAECERAVAPVSPRRVPSLLAMLMAPYHKAEVFDVAGFTAIMADRIARRPPDVVEAAIRELHDELKFMPKPAEFEAACDRQAGNRRARLAVAQAMAREHDRRKVAAAAAAAARAEAARARLAKLEPLAARLRSTLGDDAPSLQEIDAVILRYARQSSTRAQHLYDGWRAALDAGERWAAQLCTKIARGSIDGPSAGAAIQAQLDARAEAQRSDDQLAREELFLSGAPPEEILAFDQGVFDGDPETLKKVAELAAKYRTRRAQVQGKEAG